MNIAVIDIGTNTVLLLVAQCRADGEITTLAYEQRVPRLGRGVDASRNLHPDSMERVIGVLEEYKRIVEGQGITRIVACGTSAVRDAHNRSGFVDLVRKRTGLAVEILSGDEEALWTYRGAITGIAGIRKATVVDIGGGSTEITVGNAGKVQQHISLNIGSVRLTERCFKHDPPVHTELETAIDIVENELARAGRFGVEGSSMVGVAGTATSLALLDQRRKEFHREAVTGYRLQRDNVDALFRTLRSMPANGILQLSSVMEGRADIITAGALILREIMAHFRFKEMVVSERGVRYGIALREWERIQLNQQEKVQT